MRIDSIKLTNFRCFESLEMDFHPRLNVFVGVNGSGKTALLEAIKIGLIGAIGEMKEAVPQKTTGAGYAFDPKKDARLTIFERGEWIESDNVEIRFEGVLDERESRVSWSRMLKKVNVRFGHKNEFGSITPHFAALSEALQTNEDVKLPLFAYYSTGRLFLENNDTGVEMNGKRIQGYVNASTAKSSQFLFKKWFKKLENGRDRYQKHGVEFDFAAFEKVKNLIVGFLPDCKSVFYDEVRFEEVVFVFNQGTSLPYSMLSDGTKNLIALVSDLALRCAVLNPWMGKKINEVTGVVLIDEIDLHLHPSWQRMVVPALLKAFPNVQFFITTHSPQVISSVPNESLFLLKDFQESNKPLFSEGRDSNSILQDIFEVPELEEKHRVPLDEIYAVIEKGDKQEAMALLAELLAKRGEGDREVQRITSYLEFL